MSPLGPSQGRTAAPLGGLALCPSGLWLGQGLVLAVQALVSAQEKVSWSTSSSLETFRVLKHSWFQLQLSGLHACCCRGLNSSREEAAGLGACVHPPHPHTDVKKQSLFSALPFPCLPGHSLAPLCDELVSGVRAVIKEGVRVAAISSLTVTMPVPRTTSPLTHIHTITNEWIL